MPRHREKPINPLVKKLMDDHKATNIKELSLKLSLDYAVLIDLSEINGTHKYYGRLAQNAKKLGMTADELLHGLGIYA